MAVPKKVTVIVVNWNGAEFLSRCLQAIVSQSLVPHEILVVDNASSDNSVEVIREFPGIQLIAQAENLGFAQANNLALRKSSPQSEWIALINPDAFLANDWLSQMLEGAGCDPDGFYGCTLLNAADPTIIDGVGDAYHVSGIAWRSGHGKVYVPPPDIFVNEIFAPCAAAALYRRQDLISCGGFDEDFFCYMEDVDLGFRLRLRGRRAYHVPGAIALHVGSGTTGGKRSEFSTYYGHRNLVWVYLKNMPSFLFWIFLPCHLLMNLAAIVKLTLLGQGLTVVKAKIHAVRRYPEFLRKRKAIGKASQISAWALLKRLSISLRK